MPASIDSAVTPIGVSGYPESRKMSTSAANLDIIDIRSAALEFNLKEDIHAHFKPKSGPRKLPTLLLYNERGLQLFEEVTSAYLARLPPRL